MLEFCVLVLQAPYTPSDEQTESQLRDRPGPSPYRNTFSAKQSFLDAPLWNCLRFLHAQPMLIVVFFHLDRDCDFREITGHGFSIRCR